MRISFQKIKGLTLLELMVCLAIVSILYLSVIPSVQSIVLHAKITSSINLLSSVLQFARFSAIDKAQNISVCPSDARNNCVFANWQAKLIVFVDSNKNGTREEDESLLRHLAVVDEQLTTKGPSRAISFSHHGYSATPSSIKICSTSGTNNFQSRAIYISLQGKIRLAEDANKDGIYEDSKGKTISCE